MLWERHGQQQAVWHQQQTQVRPGGRWQTVAHRMYGSNKMSTCAVCRDAHRGRAGCDRCAGSGKVPEGRPYLLRAVYDEGAADAALTSSFRANLPMLLSKACIGTRDSQRTVGWRVYPGCPSFGDIAAKGAGARVPNERSFAEERRATRHWGSKRPVTDAAVLAVLLRAVRTRFIPRYAKLRLQDVVRDDKRYYVRVTGEGSNYCLNLNPARDHHSNRIWFSVDERGARVRCFCRCATTEGRRTGRCADYTSENKTLARQDQLVLFPAQTGRSDASFLERLHADVQQAHKRARAE